MFFTDSDRRMLQSLFANQLKLFSQLEQLRRTMATWQEISDNLTQRVASITTIEGSIEQLILNMKQQLSDLHTAVNTGADAAAVKANIESMMTALGSVQDRMGALVTANTPAAPADTSTPAPAPSAAPATPAAADPTMSGTTAAPAPAAPADPTAATPPASAPTTGS